LVAYRDGAEEVGMNESEQSGYPLVGDLSEAQQRLDVLERVAAAQELEHARLRERLELFRQLVENSQGLVCSHDLEGNLLYVSPASAMELGYAPDNGVGRNLREFLAPSVRPFFDGYLARILEKEADRGLLRLVNRSGEERLWAYRNVLVRLPDREPYVIGHAVDITDRVHLEALLRDNEERYRTATDGLEEGVLFKSAAGAISGWNSSAQRILGSALEHLGAGAIKEDGSPFAPEEQPDALALRTGLPSPRVVMGISRDGGEPVWISVRAHPLIRSNESGPYGVAMSFVDVTERRHHRPTLSGVLLICLYCKKIRDAGGLWRPVEIYVSDRSEAEFSHGVCSECMPRLRQEFRLSD
jgi:two-component system, OmpR family, sensor histidine kinase VicK